MSRPDGRWRCCQACDLLNIGHLIEGLNLAAEGALVDVVVKLVKHDVDLAVLCVLVVAVHGQEHDDTDHAFEADVVAAADDHLWAGIASEEAGEQVAFRLVGWQVCTSLAGNDSDFIAANQVTKLRQTAGKLGVVEKGIHGEDHSHDGVVSLVESVCLLHVGKSLKCLAELRVNDTQLELGKGGHVLLIGVGTFLNSERLTARRSNKFHFFTKWQGIRTHTWCFFWFSVPGISIILLAYIYYG